MEREGVDKLYKQKELKAFIIENKISILALLENRVKEQKARSIIEKIAKGLAWHANYHYSTRGRIWILWDMKKLNIQLISLTDQIIHGYIKCLNMTNEFYFTVVYGLHTVEDRRGLWLQLSYLANGIQNPWLIMGDFNTILRQGDRINENAVMEVEIRDFKILL